MAYLPSLTKKRVQQAVTSVFSGINRNEKINDGEFSRDMNLSTREYPMLCPRKPRGTVRTLANPAGMIAKDKLCWVDGSKVYYNGTAVDGITLSTAAADTPKQLVGFGAYVVIFPDKVYFNTVDLTEHGSLEDEFTSAAPITYTMCRLDGSDYDTVASGATAPEDPENGDYWIDTSTDEHRLMVYSSTYGMWQQILTVYTRVTCAGISDHFKTGDTITLSGIRADPYTPPEETEEEQTAEPAEGADSEAAYEKAAAQLAALNGSQYVYGHGEGWITVLGLLDQTLMQSATPITAQRKTPDMEFVIEDGNRLWGCHYGEGENGQMLNEIYACKLGDFKNWRVYQGISTDSYAVSLGSDGPFTGAISYGGYPMFFKETCVHKIFGNQPKNYQVMTTQMRGVKRGCEKSLAIVDGTLLYMSPMGVEAYDGSLPSNISTALGDADMQGAVAGCLGTRYYMAVLEGEDGHVYVYDARMNIWHEEDGAKALCFVPYEHDLYMLDADTGEVLTMTGTAGTLEDAVEWSAETGLIGWETVDQKYLTRYNIRAVLPEGANMAISLQYNSKGQWHKKMNLTNAARSTRTLLMPVYPHRCDHMRMRLEGRGEVKLYSIARILSSGGDGQRG